MPPDWVLKTIGEVAADDEGAIAIGPFGSSMKSDLYTESGIPIIRGNNLTGKPGFYGELAFVSEATAARFPRCIVQPGDLVFPHRGAIGEVGLVTGQGYGKWLLSTSMMKLRPHPHKLDSRFAFYFFRSAVGRHQLLRNASQVGTPGIGQPLTSLRACEIALPPLHEQRAIASVLGALDDKIEQNQRTCQALEGLARAVFKAWFVDFEPVRAKIAGATGYPSMHPATFAALPNRLTESPLGQVPEGWAVRPLDQVIAVNPPRRLQKGVEAPYLDMGDMPTGGHAPAAWTTRAAGSGARFMNGDTLVARITPCLENGKTAFVDFLRDGEIAWGSTEYIVLCPHPPLPSIFAYLLARTTEFRNFAIHNMTGTSGRQRVPFTALSHFLVPVASDTVLSSFAALVHPLIAKSSAAQHESRSLAELRDILIPQLLSGRLRLREALQE